MVMKNPKLNRVFQSQKEKARKNHSYIETVSKLLHQPHKDASKGQGKVNKIQFSSFLGL